MTTRRWNVPVKADGLRSNELVAIRYDRNNIAMQISEQDSGDTQWRFLFTTTQALRVTTWESAHEVLTSLPIDGGFFERTDSDLLRSLGPRHYMGAARHFVISCYDEVVEVVAHHVEVSRVESGSGTMRR